MFFLKHPQLSRQGPTTLSTFSVDCRLQLDVVKALFYYANQNGSHEQ